MRTATYFQVRSDSLLLYDLPLEHRGRRHQLPIPSKNTYSGYVTPHAKKRLRKALDILVQKSTTHYVYNSFTEKFMPFRMGFITLTIATQKNLKAKESYETLLGKWLRYMKRKQGLKSYVWKAELQKRGQVHYHLMSDVFIDAKTIRWYWNKLQRKAGYLDSFAKIYHHYKPPSTHVRSAIDLGEINAYVAKEMCKGVQNQKSVQGKVWDCSTNLKINRYSDFLTNEMEALIDDAIQHGFAEVVETEHCTIIKTDSPKLLLSKSEQVRYHKYITS